jgi:hypothetical protein
VIACDSISGLGHFHGANWLSGEKLRSKLLAAVDDGMISPCVVIALRQQHRTFFDRYGPRRFSDYRAGLWHGASRGHCFATPCPAQGPSNAVKYLTDSELDLLIAASVEEAKRRGRLSPSVQPNPTDEPVLRQSSSRDKRQAEDAKVSLTRGQVNAVRAALKAGIKPSQIARQFGVSQSDMKNVLASDTATPRTR